MGLLKVFPDQKKKKILWKSLKVKGTVFSSSFFYPIAEHKTVALLRAELARKCGLIKATLL